MNLTTIGPPFPWPDPDFDRNRDRLPAAELNKWSGQHVAWSWDGTRVVAGATTLPALLTELQRRNVDNAGVVFDFIDPPDSPA